MIFLPIVGRELSVTARRAGTYWLRFWAAVFMLTVFSLLLVNGWDDAPATLGRSMFDILSLLALLFCLFAGAFLTSDCLLEEMREGTLGLLFLTDLCSHDVVLGKMAASSLRAFFGLVAAFPILGLTLLLGGVTFGEFARVALALMATLFFSLSIGIFMSALGRSSRFALGMTIFCVLFVSAVFPAAWGFVTLLLMGIPNGPSTPFFIMLPSPVYAYARAFDGFYAHGPGPKAFWLSILTVLAAAVWAIRRASRNLPAAWRNYEANAPARLREESHSDVAQLSSRAERKALLEVNPYQWLSLRDGASVLLFVGMLLAVYPFLLMLMAGPVGVFTISTMVFFVVKLAVPAMAGGRLNRDCRSGAFELLLVTPLGVPGVLAGQRASFWRRIRGFAYFLMAMNLVGCLVALISGQGDDKFTFLIIGLGGVAALFADIHALSWMGMWQGLKSPGPGRAVLATLLWVFPAQYVLLSLTTALFELLGSKWQWQFDLIAWYVLRIGCDLMVARYARRKLSAQFQTVVVERFQARSVL